MRKIIYFVFAALTLGLATTACSWLDEPTPKGQISTDKLTDGDLSLLTNGVLHQYEAFLYNVWSEGDYLAENLKGGPGFDYSDPHGDTQSASASIPLTRWQYCYNKLNYANLLIKSALGVQNQDSADVKNALGTGYFFRALIYFNLVERYGGVPINTVPANTTIIPRSTEEEVWNFILEDLAKAESYLSDFSSWVYPSKELCRAFQAKIALWLKDYNTAIAKADMILEKGFVLSSTSEEFASMFINGTQSKEIIFAPVNIRTSDNIRIYVMFNDTDGSYSYSPTDVCYQHLFDDDAYRAGDIRKKATFSEESALPVIKFPNGQGGQFIKNPDPSQSPIMCVRLADIYLAKVEALWALDRNGEALEVFKEFLESRYTAVNLPTTLSKEEIEAMILDENRREFYAEGHRWFDVKRIGLNQHSADFSTWINTQYDEWKGRDFLIYWPIPQVERDKANGQYTQNPGYSGYTEQ